MTQIELTALRNLHLYGYFGFPFGALKKEKREALIAKWIDEGIITADCGLTKKGIEMTLPSVKPFNVLDKYNFNQFAY